ncbi:MAG: Xaa-Pro peptidase family protein [Gemmatimonadetes bacterium]|nr:Xaa-Pro peptidase family protein [Gemmatimonadota bacterium]
MLTSQYADFDACEYERRLTGLRDLMSRDHLDAVLITTDTNHRYFTGHWTHRWGHKFTSLFALLPLERDPVLIVPPLETGMCEEDAWVEDLRTYQPPIRVRAGVSLLTEVIRELGPGARVGAETGGVLWSRMPYDDFGQLKSNLPGVEFTDASQLLWKTRFTKSSAEIEYIRQAVGITNRSYRTLFDTVRPGMTERDLYSLLCVEHLKRGMDAPGSITLAACIPGDARSSNRSLRRHTERVLTEGELIAHDAGGVYRGYWSDYTRMFGLGRAVQKHKDAYRTVHECLQAAVGTIRPGIPISDLVRVSNMTLKRAGYAEQARHVTGIGHAIGLDIIEPPFIELEDDTLLEEGMVLTVEPSLYTEGAYFMLEEDVVVTDSGFEILSEPAPEDLPVL